MRSSHAVPADLPPGVVVRAASVAEMQDFRFVNQASFGAQGLPDRYAAILQHPEWTTCVFDRGELATTLAAWPLSMKLNGRPAAVARVTAVSTSADPVPARLHARSDGTRPDRAP